MVWHSVDAVVAGRGEGSGEEMSLLFLFFLPWPVPSGERKGSSPLDSRGASSIAATGGGGVEGRLSWMSMGAIGGAFLTLGGLTFAPGVVQQG